MEYRHGTYYKANIVSVFYVTYGKEGEEKRAVDILVKLADGSQDVVRQGLATPKQSGYVMNLLVNLGCDAAKLRQSGWAKYASQTLAGVGVNIKAEEYNGETKLKNIYPLVGREVADDESPFAAPAGAEYWDDVPL